MRSVSSSPTAAINLR